MPRELQPNSEVDELGVIHLARDHGWINPWKPAIASCIRSSQDIWWIPIVAKMLCLIYYVRSYATKDDGFLVMFYSIYSRKYAIYSPKTVILQASITFLSVTHTHLGSTVASSLPFYNRPLPNSL